MKNLPKQIIKKIFNQIGFDITKTHKTPAQTLLGLRNLNIRTIIDIGANKGQFAKMISNIFPQSKIYCFEPLSEPFNALSQFAEKNNRITSYNFALGDREGDLNIFSHIEHSPSSSFLKTTNTCEQLYPMTKKQISTKVKITTLDGWRENFENPLPLDILIKCDVQGCEDRVIRGGARTFSMAKACLLEINLDCLYEGQATFKDIFLLLHNLGFKYAGNVEQHYAQDGHTIFIEAVFVNKNNQK